MTDARREDYWEQVEEEQESIMDLVRSDAGEWEIRGAILSGETSDSLYLTVLRTKVGDDQQLLLSERYWYCDRDDPQSDHGWLKNGISRRVNGKLVDALAVLYSAMSNGDATAESPIVMDSTDQGIDHSPGALLDPISEQAEQQSEQEKQDGSVRFSGARSETETETETVTCAECRAEIPREEAENFGSESIGDLWICAGEHVGDQS